MLVWRDGPVHLSYRTLTVTQKLIHHPVTYERSKFGFRCWSHDPVPLVGRLDAEGSVDCLRPNVLRHTTLLIGTRT